MYNIVDMLFIGRLGGDAILDEEEEVNEEVEENESCSDDRPKHKIINCWSGPRSLSTSLMYSFHNRGSSSVERCIALLSW